MPNNLYGAAHETIANRHEQRRSSKTLSPPQKKCRATQLSDPSYTAKQKKSLCSGTTAHMKNMT